jgi:hypothetical protein
MKWILLLAVASAAACGGVNPGTGGEPDAHEASDPDAGTPPPDAPTGAPPCRLGEAQLGNCTI